MSGMRVNEIAAKKADLEHDNKLWSAKDALLDAVDRVEGKKVNLGVYWFEIQEDGSRVLCYSLSNLDRFEEITLLEIRKAKALEDMRK